MNKSTKCLTISENGQSKCTTKLHMYFCEEYIYRTKFTIKYLVICVELLAFVHNACIFKVSSHLLWYLILLTTANYMPRIYQKSTTLYQTYFHLKTTLLVAPTGSAEINTTPIRATSFGHHSTPILYVALLDRVVNSYFDAGLA